MHLTAQFLRPRYPTCEDADFFPSFSQPQTLRIDVRNRRGKYPWASRDTLVLFNLFERIVLSSTSKSHP